MAPTDRPLVAIVDDDELFRRSIERLVRSAGFNVATFASAEDFLDSADLDRAACAILDMRLFLVRMSLVTVGRSCQLREPKFARSAAGALVRVLPGLF